MQIGHESLVKGFGAGAAIWEIAEIYGNEIEVKRCVHQGLHRVFGKQVLIQSGFNGTMLLSNHKMIAIFSLLQEPYHQAFQEGGNVADSNLKII